MSLGVSDLKGGGHQDMCGAFQSVSTPGHYGKVAGDQRPNTVHWWAALIIKPRVLQVFLIILDLSGHTEMFPQLCELLDEKNTQWGEFHSGAIEAGWLQPGILLCGRYLKMMTKVRGMFCGQPWM